MTEPQQPLSLQYASVLPEDLPIPGDVKVVAWVFVAMGILAVLQFVIGLFNGAVTLQFDIVLIWAGRGILKRSRGWRTCGLVFCWIHFFVIAVFALLMGGGGLGRTRSWGIMLLLLGFVAVSVWQYIVLTRPRARAWFGLLT